MLYGTSRGSLIISFIGSGCRGNYRVSCRYYPNESLVPLIACFSSSYARFSAQNERSRYHHYPTIAGHDLLYRTDRYCATIPEVIIKAPPFFNERYVILPSQIAMRAPLCHEIASSPQNEVKKGMKRGKRKNFQNHQKTYRLLYGSRKTSPEPRQNPGQNYRTPPYTPL